MPEPPRILPSWKRYTQILPDPLACSVESVGSIGKPLHEKVLASMIYEFRQEGYRVIPLHGKSPDAIAIKDGNVYALDAMQVHYSRKGKMKDWDVQQKAQSYPMFDDTIIWAFAKPPPEREEPPKGKPHSR